MDADTAIAAVCTGIRTVYETTEHSTWLDGSGEWPYGVESLFYTSPALVYDALVRLRAESFSDRVQFAFVRETERHQYPHIEVSYRLWRLISQEELDLSDALIFVDRSQALAKDWRLTRARERSRKFGKVLTRFVAAHFLMFIISAVAARAGLLSASFPASALNVGLQVLYLCTELVTLGAYVGTRVRATYLERRVAYCPEVNAWARATVEAHTGSPNESNCE